MGDEIELENAGDKVYFRGPIENLNIEQDYENRHGFEMSGKIAASGNCNSLIGNSVTLGDYQFVYLFYECTSLTTSPELPATTLAESCYDSMFYECTSLLTAPELPATTMADYCYWGMFKNCTELTVAPELPATTLAESCYEEMFCECIALTQGPSRIPATVFPIGCCRFMFSYCDSLTNCPTMYVEEAQAASMLCMFGNQEYVDTHGITNASNITIAASVIQTTDDEYTLGACQEMFSNCVNLIIPPNFLNTVEIQQNGCSGMFYNCRSLTRSPNLLATTLGEGCCQSMFEGCESLTEITMSYTGEFLADNGWSQN